MNNRGFTLIELLAAMTLLAILSAITVPTVLNTMETTRKTTVLSDSKKFLSKVEKLLQNNNNTIKKPRSNSECIIVTLGYLEDTTDFQVGPHGYKYSINSSYVVVKKNDSTFGTDSFTGSNYNYYVSLVEEYDDGETGYYGIQNAFDDGTGDSNTTNVLRSKKGREYVDGILKPYDPTSDDTAIDINAIATQAGCLDGKISNLYDKERLTG